MQWHKIPILQCCSLCSVHAVEQDPCTAVLLTMQCSCSGTRSLYCSVVNYAAFIQCSCSCTSSLYCSVVHYSVFMQWHKIHILQCCSLCSVHAVAQDPFTAVLLTMQCSCSGTRSLYCSVVLYVVFMQWHKIPILQCRSLCSVHAVAQDPYTAVLFTMQCSCSCIRSIYCSVVRYAVA